MKIRHRIFCFLFAVISFQLSATTSTQEDYVNALGSMTFYLNQCQDDSPAEGIAFADEQVEHLWNRIFEHGQRKELIFLAYTNYLKSKELAKVGQFEKSKNSIAQSFEAINGLWEKSIDDELELDLVASKEKPSNSNYAAYPHLSSEMKKRFAGFIIPDHHPMKSKLDQIFGTKRVTANKDIFLKSGFKIISERPRSFVIVCAHKLLPKYLLKCYLDTEKREKWDRPSWHWLEQRCVGVKAVSKVINSKNLKYFAAPEKYLYILPLVDRKHTSIESFQRHPVLLLAEDMQLVSEKDNLYAWKNIMDKKRCEELYTIISRAKGASYRSDNIAYNKHGKFCFIDTEYPTKGPSYYRIGRELPSNLAEYWNYLVRHGGPGSKSSSHSHRHSSNRHS